MENRDRARERSQAGAVQHRRFGLNLNTDELGASSTHPDLSLPPRPQRAASPACSIPRPAGTPSLRGGCCLQLGSAWPLLSAEGGGMCCRPTRVTAELDPSWAVPCPVLMCSTPGGGRLPHPGQKEPADLCSEPGLGLGRCFLAVQAEPLFLSPQLNAHRQPACVALGLLSPWRNKVQHRGFWDSNRWFQGSRYFSADA